MNVFRSLVKKLRHETHENSRRGEGVGDLSVLECDALSPGE